MIRIKYDTADLAKKLNNVVEYSYGFTRGIEISKKSFNKELAEIVKEVIGKYIDAKARANPESFHHIYEWGAVGNPSQRLFDFKITYGSRNIIFTGHFLPSSSTSPNSSESFVDKARVMENQISVTIEPKNAEVLAFEDDGNMIFSSSSITIDNPGGDEVGGSFERAVRQFFNQYLTVGLLKATGIFEKIAYPKEYANSFSQGARSGTGPGILAGKKYLSLGGIIIE